MVGPLWGGHGFTFRCTGAKPARDDILGIRGLTHHRSRPYDPIMQMTIPKLVTLILTLTFTTSLEAKGRTGRLNIDSFTPGAEIFVDGERVGTTPLKTALRLRVGRRTVR